ncbi:MAG: phosphate/phosphite/phosphonate ABC transporter substrate-binding protein [Planctomycetota bacterium]
MSEKPVPDASGKPSAKFSPILIAVLVLLTAVVLGFAYYQNSTAKSAGRADNTLNLELLGLGAPVVNRLDEAYTDSDEDLVADPPADATQLRTPEVLRFSYLSAKAADIDPTNWRPLMDALAQGTGKQIEYVQHADVEAQLIALRSGALDITAFNTGNVPRAVNAAGFVPVAAPAQDGELASYETLIVAGTDTGISKVEDLRGKLVAFTRVGSNSGFKAPMVNLFRDFDMQPERDFDPAFTGSHTNTIEEVAKGAYVAGSVASDLFQSAIAEGKVDPKKFKTIYTSPAFPRAALGHAHDLAPGLAAAITETLLGFELSSTTVADEFIGQEVNGFAELAYKDDFALVRLIDDAVGFKHAIEPGTEPDSERSSAE